MQTANKKLIKEIKAIYASCDKAKKLALADIDKIDAKYKALADKEKQNLAETIKFLDSQLATYGSMISKFDVQNDEKESEDATAEPESVPEETMALVEEEDKVIDDLFPENNEGTESEATIPEEESTLDADSDTRMLVEEPISDTPTSGRWEDLDSMPEVFSEETTPETVAEPEPENAPEFDGAGFTEADNEPVTESGPTSKPAPETEAADDSSSDDEWPTEAEEW